MLDGFRDRVLDRGKIANVRGDGETLSAEPLDRGFHRLQIFFLAARDRELCAMFRERPCNAPGNAGAAAGDESNFPLEDVICEYCVGHKRDDGSTYVEPPRRRDAEI